MNQFLHSNPGLRSRFNHYVEFEDYAPNELLAIFSFFCKDSEYVIECDAQAALSDKFTAMFEAGQTISNGRLVRNIYERCIEVQAERVSQECEIADDLCNLSKADIFAALEEVISEQKSMEDPMNRPVLDVEMRSDQREDGHKTTGLIAIANVRSGVAT
jgi:hypothetical protein